MQKYSLSSKEENLLKKKIRKLEKIGMLFSWIFGTGCISIFTPIINISRWIPLALCVIGGTVTVISVCRRNKLKSIIEEAHKIVVKKYVKY